MQQSQEVEMAAQLQRACDTLEHAADAASRQAADQFLQAFRASARPYTLCMLLLASAASGAQTQFVALATMKEALRREGRLLGAAALTAMKDQLLALLSQRAPLWSRYVTNQALHLVAILCKWICLDADEREIKSKQAQAAAAAPPSRAGRGYAAAPSPPPDTPAADPSVYLSMATSVAQWMQRGMECLDAECASGQGAPPSNAAPGAALWFSLAVELSVAMLTEFSPGGHAANAGVSVTMHVRCHTRFEEHVLLNLAGVVVQNCLPDVMRRLMAQAQAQQQANIHHAPVTLLQLSVLRSLLAFLDATLHFEFRDPKRVDQMALRWAIMATSSSSGSDDVAPPLKTAARPSLKWRPIIVQAPLIEMLSTAHALLHGQLAGLEHWSSLGDAQHLVRIALVRLSAIQGDILKDPLPDPNAPQQSPTVRGPLAYLQRMMTATVAALGRSVGRASAQLAAQAQSQQGTAAQLDGAELIGLSSICYQLVLDNVEALLSLPDPACFPQLLNLLLQLAMLMVPLCAGGKGCGVSRDHAPAVRRGQTTDTSAQECLDLVLDVWYQVIYQVRELAVDAAVSINQSAFKEAVSQQALQQIQQVIQQCSGALFQSLVITRIEALLPAAEAAAAGRGAAAPSSVLAASTGDGDGEADDEEDSGQFADGVWIDAHLENVAMLGRCHLQAALQLVGARLNQALTIWQTAMESLQSGRAPPGMSLYAIHELLFYLMRLLGHLVSDHSKWSDIEEHDRFAAIPKLMLAACATEPGALALKAAVDALMNLAIFIVRLLEQRPAAPAGALIPFGSSPLKVCCSPLVLECFAWLLQQLVSAGYFFIDVRCVQKLEAKDAVAQGQFPLVLLQLYAATNGRDTGQILQVLLQLCGAMLTHYSEESALVSEMLDLLTLCVRHIPLRAALVAQLVDPAQNQVQSPGSPSSVSASTSLFRTLFRDSLMSLLTTDPFALMGESAGSSSSSASSQQHQQLLLQFQVSQPFLNLSPAELQSVSHILTLAVVPPAFDTSSDASREQALMSVQMSQFQAAQSVQLLHSFLVPTSRAFYGILLSPGFASKSTRSPVLKSLTGLVSFFTGLVRELSVDHFEFLWFWLTCTQHALAIPAAGATGAGGGGGGGGGAEIMAHVKAKHKEVQSSVHAMRKASGLPAGSNNPQLQQALAGITGMNLMQSMVDLVRAYTSADSAADGIEHPDSCSSSLELLSCILEFFTALCTSFLSYLDVNQSMNFMSCVLALVGAYTNHIDARTAATQRALHSLQTQVTGSGPLLQSRTHLVLKSEKLSTELDGLVDLEWVSLQSLLTLLEGLSMKDLVDLSTESVEFASDAVLAGLVLLVPRLESRGQILSHPLVAAKFFELLGGLIASNPEKLASALDQGQRDGMMRMISMVLQQTSSTTAAAANSPGSGSGSSANGSTTAPLHSTLLKEACLAVGALAEYHLYFTSGRAEADRAARAAEDAQAAQEAPSPEAAKRAAERLAQREPLPPPSPYGPACASFLESLLQLLLFAPVSSEPLHLESISDALLPSILCQPAHFVTLVQRALAQWKEAQTARIVAERAAQAAQGPLDPSVAAAQIAQLEALAADLESGFRALIPTLPPNAATKGATAGVRAVGGRFSSLSSRTLQAERSQRNLFRAQVRSFVLTARPLLAMR